MSQPALAALLLGCGVAQRTPSSDRNTPFACVLDADCGGGAACVSELGICTRRSGRLETLLFEVTPQPSDPVYGGARFLTFLNVAEAPARGSRLELNVRPRVPVTGRVLAAPEQSACLDPSRSTLKALLTFTPRERLLGLSLPSYQMKTEFDDTLLEYAFTGALPPGRYDVYIRPEVNPLTEGCRAIPQIFRGRSVGLQGAVDQLELQQPPPAALRLTIDWDPALDGWQLDMVHPITTEVISNRVILRSTDVDPTSNTLVTTLNYSRADPDFLTGAEELVRFTPPPDVRAGTVLFQRGGLELVRGEGAIGTVSTFGTPVEYQAWVWKEGQEDVPVPAEVTFSAVDLEEVEDGVFAFFEVTASVDQTGQVHANLLPGTYRVRVTPPGVAMDRLGAMTAYESTITVWPNGDPALDQQAGHVIPVPPAVTLNGRVLAGDRDTPLAGVEVRASAANPERNLCPEAIDAGAPRCQRPRAPVLQRALAQDPFIPRTRSALTRDDGEFTLAGLDCGRCKPEQTALFDLSVRPDVSSGLPWRVQRDVDPFADEQTMLEEPLRLPMPIVRPMHVTYGNAMVGAGGAPSAAVNQSLSGAVVRVYAVLDARGELVTQPEDLPPCVAATNLDDPCLQSTLQLAEGRTDANGQFLLLLPPDLN